jgi:HKD family nuclease
VKGSNALALSAFCVNYAYNVAVSIKEEKRAYYNMPLGCTKEFEGFVASSY